ncbi:hypothetical protein AYI69_g2095 [Smittium culicis]|uniref:Uncharacterized protein n=1 Tax=Smittium culicis TaxID=133412 RepID=A0A1R1YNH2_9FUNG|nr:hypothetical protein AYI69_g2095 [Smittium culicis]
MKILDPIIERVIESNNLDRVFFEIHYTGYEDQGKYFESNPCLISKIHQNNQISQIDEGRINYDTHFNPILSDNTIGNFGFLVVGNEDFCENYILQAKLYAKSQKILSKVNFYGTYY